MGDVPTVPAEDIVAEVTRQAPPDWPGPRPPADLEPVRRSPDAWGSDAIAEAVRATGVPFVAFTPGSSIRGLHDSLEPPR